MCRPHLLLPKLPEFPEDGWTRIRIVRPSIDAPLEIITTNDPLPEVETRHRSNVYEVLCRGIPAISKIAAFDWQISSLERETWAYSVLDQNQRLELDEPKISPRVLGHLPECGRVMGILLERLDGEFASADDLPNCSSTLGRLHEIGLVHGDVNRYTFIVDDNQNRQVRMVVFEHAAALDEIMAKMELQTLVSELKEDTGRGGESTPYCKTCGRVIGARKTDASRNTTPAKYCSSRCKSRKPGALDRRIEEAFVAQLEGKELPTPDSEKLGEVVHIEDAQRTGREQISSRDSKKGKKRPKGDSRVLVSCTTVEILVFGDRFDPEKTAGRKRDRAKRGLPDAEEWTSVDMTDDPVAEEDKEVVDGDLLAQVNGGVGGEKGRAERIEENEEMLQKRMEGQQKAHERELNNGKFWVVVFAGEPLRTAASLKALRAYLDSDGSFTKRLTNAFDFLTIIAGTGLQPDETLGVDRIGRACYDVDHAAYSRYGISTGEGAIVVLRPDGILAFAAGLDQGADVGTYFDAIVPLQSTIGRGAHNRSREGNRLKSFL
ncbi:hypothetical protein MBLNU13_g09292t2 [Cladosporium sp. NU13]